MWLPWTYSLPLAGMLLALGALARQRSRPGAAAVAVEASRVALLYTLWQVAGRLSVSGIERASERGLWLWDLERSLMLPDEAALQRLMLPHDWLVQAANIYYGGAHVPGMGLFLIWMFLRHRQAYPGWRNVLVVITFVSLVIQLIPVAPPRLIPSLGMVDTAVAHGQSVYAIGGSTVAGQLQALPSLHVGWAALVALATWQLGRSWARWIGLAHFALTFVVVAVTANHYWLDGIACMALLAPAALLLTGPRQPAIRAADQPGSLMGEAVPTGEPVLVGELRPEL
jgi:hypothetical protein